jgi:polyisoprenoid-binding protein YceI
MKKITVSIGLILGMSSAWAAPETYVIDGKHTFPRFSYSHFGYSTQLSRFDKTSGTIVLDAVAKRGSANVIIDTSSVNTGLAVFNEHIQKEEFLNTVQFPTATFVSSQFNFEGDALKSIDGKLTIKGISKDLTLRISSFLCMPHPMAKKEACGVNASTVIKRSDFNMGKHVPYVSDDVTIDIPVEAIKQ